MKYSGSKKNTVVANLEWFQAKEDGSSNNKSKGRLVAKINNGGSTNQNYGNNKIEVVPDGSNKKSKTGL